ncbi:hypothetical protein NSQ82_06100 [Caldifermentibacillus hisashii]|uniref:hypothetical protein n=1 Tax=Caldifermentibacillus hisashii TaxID=996558 RepID=UPI0031B6D376
MAENKISFWILTALVVGNMVGSEIFMLPRTLSEAASPAGVLLGWGVYRNQFISNGNPSSKSISAIRKAFS